MRRKILAGRSDPHPHSPRRSNSKSVSLTKCLLLLVHLTVISRRFVKLSRLFVSFVGLHFDLLDDVLKAGPFFWNHCHKLQAELPSSAPPDKRLLNLNGRFVLSCHDPNLQ